jgi:uncharacterized protein (TIGR02453 family)
MKDLLDLEPVLIFLNELSKNNNKVWFEANRDKYEKTKDSFERFIDFIIDEFREPDSLNGLTARECTSRIYRDIRFSKDKSPYKTNMWATIAPGGKKTMRMGYHVALQPQGRSIIAGGMWEPVTDQLLKFRQAIARDATQFKKIITAKDFVDYFGKIEGEKLKTVPQGFDKTHPELEILKLKQVVVVHYFSDEEVLASNFAQRVIAGCKAMRPFLDYLENTIL